MPRTLRPTSAPRLPWWAVLARLRWVLGRHPWIHWSIAASCATVVGTRVAGAEAAADAAAASWGRTVTVWVAGTSLRAGDPVVAVARHYPAAMVPATAVAQLAPGSRAAHDVGAGEVLDTTDLASERTPPLDWVVLGLPADRAPATRPGDPAVLFGAGTRRCDGIVVAGDDRVVEVAVPPACAAAVTTDLAAGDATLGRGIGG